MHKEAILVPIIAGVVIKKDGKYLLVQEKKASVYGQWNFPAGKVDVGDTIEETAIKEAKEESGYDVELIRKIGVFHESEKLAPKHAFEAKIVGGQLAYPKDEILDANWFTLAEIKAMKEKLRGAWILNAISILEND